jgi:hypothetical protein
MERKSTVPPPSPSVVAAGVYELREQSFGTPYEQVVTAIYYAMAYQAQSEAFSLPQHGAEISKG